MAVSVRTNRVRSGRAVINVHESAGSIAVKEGHLHARKWDGAGYKTVAVYAPGNWVDATTETAEAEAETE